jgi:hypothetical protein
MAGKDERGAAGGKGKAGEHSSGEMENSLSLTGPSTRMPPLRAGQRRLLMALRAPIPPAYMPAGTVGLAALSQARIPGRCVTVGARRSCALDSKSFYYRILLVQLPVVARRRQQAWQLASSRQASRATSRGRACRLAGGSTPTADRQGLIQWKYGAIRRFSAIRQWIAPFAGWYLASPSKLCRLQHPRLPDPLWP